jgi:hypothetical protein
VSNNSIKVQPSATGTNLQTFENTVGAVAVDAEAVVLVRSSDNTEIGTAAQPVRVDPVGTTAQPVTQSGAPWSVTVVPGTSGGTSDYHAVAAGSTNLATVKASAGQLFGWNIFNNAAYPIYVKLFNKASNPLLGTDVPVRTIGIQAGTETTFFNSLGMVFSLGIAVAITKLIADADATAVLANDGVIDLDFK